MFWVKLGIVIVVLCMIGYWFYPDQVHHLRNQAETRLLNIASLKAKQITDRRNERLDDAGAIMESLFFCEGIA